MTPARTRFLDKARSYAATISPNDKQAHELCCALVAILADDRDQRVAVVVGAFVVAQGGNDTGAPRSRAHLST